MSVLDEIKPIQKRLVMDLLREAGVDIEQWKNFRGVNPSTNPKYCYNWSFEQPGEVVVVCLWHKNLKQEDGRVIYHRKPRAFASIRKEPGANVWNRRDADFGKSLELAYRQQLPIRVIVVEGKQRDAADSKPKASLVKARILDQTEWAVTEFNYSTGECLLVRGVKPILPAVASLDLELSWFEGKSKQGFVNHRRREGMARRAKIQEAQRANGGKLICEVQHCGFDFAERYGTLGEGYAQVHHLVPVSQSPKKGRDVVLKDLAIVCANCHAMIHAGGACRPLAGLIPAPTK